jgi:hypothetical protein
MIELAIVVPSFKGLGHSLPARFILFSLLGLCGALVGTVWNDLAARAFNGRRQ